MPTLNDILEQKILGDVYRVTTHESVVEIRDKLMQHGFAVFHIEGVKVTDLLSFFSEYAAAIEFPGTHGKNWDALWDSLRDLSWHPAKGYVIVYDDIHVLAANHPDKLLEVFQIMRMAARERNQHHPLYILFVEEESLKPDFVHDLASIELR